MMRYVLAILITCTSLISCGATQEMTAGGRESEVPVATIRISIVPGGQQRMLESMEEFADQESFAIRVGHPGPTDSHVTVQMWREDYKILAVNPFSPQEFRVSFYKNSEKSGPKDTLDHLENQLKLRLSKIEGLTITAG